MKGATIEFRLHDGTRSARVNLPDGTHQLDWPKMSRFENRTLPGGYLLEVTMTDEDRYHCLYTNDNGQNVLFSGFLEYIGNSTSLSPEYSPDPPT